MTEKRLIRVPKSYKKQNGCWNCEHAFVYSEYDEGCIYYCHYDKSERPLCGSVAMEESFWDNSLLEDKEGEIRMELWEAWADNHAVSYSGICDFWKRLEKK